MKKESGMTSVFRALTVFRKKFKYEICLTEYNKVHTKEQCFDQWNNTSGQTASRKRLV